MSPFDVRETRDTRSGDMNHDAMSIELSLRVGVGARHAPLQRGGMRGSEGPVVHTELFRYFVRSVANVTRLCFT